MKKKLLEIQKSLIRKVYKEWGKYLDVREIVEIFNDVSKQKVYRAIKEEENSSL